jgi:hypothetical protein
MTMRIALRVLAVLLLGAWGARGHCKICVEKYYEGLDMNCYGCGTIEEDGAEECWLDKTPCPMLVNCHTSGDCDGEDPQPGPIVIFPILFTVGGGNYVYLPTTHELTTFSIDEIRGHIAEDTEVDEGDVELVFGGLGVSTADFPTRAFTKANGNGFSVSSGTSGSTTTYRICEHTEYGDTLVGSDALEDGEVLLAHVEIDSTDYVLALYMEEYTDAG